MIESHVTLYQRYDMYMANQEKLNEQSVLSGNPLAVINPNLPPMSKLQVKEPFSDIGSTISNEDYLLVVNKLNEFADSTLTFGEALLKKIEEAGLNDELLR